MCESDRDHLIQAIDAELAERNEELKELEFEWTNSCQCCADIIYGEDIEKLEASIANLEKQRREILA